MKVAFCSLPLKTGHKTRGIGAYTRNLLEALRKIDGVEIFEFGDLSEVRNADIVHYPFFDLFQNNLSSQKKIPIVVTIHDVIPLVYSQAYPPGIKGWWNNYLQKKSLRDVAAVITDSQASRKDIIKYLGVPAGKIYPVYLAPAGHFHKINDRNTLEEIAKKYNLPLKFALYTGNVNYNKNLLNLSEAALKAGIDLVLIGKSFEEKEGLNHPELKSFKNFLNQYATNPKIHILGFVPDGELVAITNLATMLILPSLAEGFGMPILEAQLCEVPVITSNVSSMPEVAGRGALLINPLSVEDIFRAIVQLKENKIVRDALIKEGLSNINRFSWKSTADETLKVYEKILLH